MKKLILFLMLFLFCDVLYCQFNIGKTKEELFEVFKDQAAKMFPNKDGTSDFIAVSNDYTTFYGFDKKGRANCGIVEPQTISSLTLMINKLDSIFVKKETGKWIFYSVKMGAMYAVELTSLTGKVSFVIYEKKY